MAPRKRPPRRKPGTGAIRFKRGRDRPWEAAFPLGHGEYRYDSFQERSEAAEFLDRLTRERDDTTAPRNIAGGSQLVRTFLPAWLSTKQPHVKPKTFSGYQYYCELASGEIGNLRLDQVTREEAAALLRRFHRRGFQNVAPLRAVLRQAFEFALEEDYIKRNPFQKAKAPPVERRPALALTRAQRAHLLDCATIEDDPAVPLQALWHLYCRLGLRKGEGMGVRWCDVDWTNATLTIAQQYTNVGKETARSTPKTPRSRRTLPLPADVVELLRALLADQRKRAAADLDWAEHGLIFPDAHGAPLKFSYVPWRWAKLRKRAGLPEQVRLHDLRHTSLYLMEQDGVPQSVRMAIAGHSAVAMASHYADHADMEAMRRAVG